MPKTITLNSTKYTEDSKCPSCSSEVDNGGRLEIRKRKRVFLNVINVSTQYLEKRQDRKKNEEKQNEMG